MLCSICHQRPATVHLTTIVDGSQHRQDFCESCARSFDLGAAANKVTGNSCDFCGAPAIKGAGPGGESWCQKCAESFGRIIQEVYAETPRPADPAQYAAWKQGVMAEAAKRLKGHSSQR